MLLLVQYLMTANTIEQMKQESLKSLEEQKKEYGPMGNTKIVGKDSLVEFLKNYRNGLKEYTDNISTQINNIIKENK